MSPCVMALPTSLVTRVMWRHFLLPPTCSLACEPTTNERTPRRLGVVQSSPSVPPSVRRRRAYTVVAYELGSTRLDAPLPSMKIAVVACRRIRFGKDDCMPRCPPASHGCSQSHPALVFQSYRVRFPHFAFALLFIVRRSASLLSPVAAVALGAPLLRLSLSHLRLRAESLALSPSRSLARSPITEALYDDIKRAPKNSRDRRWRRRRRRRRRRHQNGA